MKAWQMHPLHQTVHVNLMNDFCFFFLHAAAGLIQTSLELQANFFSAAELELTSKFAGRVSERKNCKEIAKNISKRI